jgi:reversibly glycosylated polypeptide/UDP-arabinopyranose mutase
VKVLVVPTNRPERLVEFLDAWSPWPWDRIVVVEDAPGVTFALPPRRPAGGTWPRERLEVASWAEIDATLPVPWIISRRDSAIRSWGFWRAWMLGAEYVFTLDDDCFPGADDHVATHVANLEATPAWTSSVPGFRVRGLPYRNLGRLTNVVASVGLWTGHADLDAVQTLAGGPDGIDPDVGTRVMPADQYFPLSGMNVAFRRDVACLLYFPRMGAGSPYARFDDIWGGLVLQRVCRHLRYAIVCGRPFVEHRRASDPFTNLVKEAPGIAANERIWERIDAIALSATTPLECMREVGDGLAAAGDPYVAEWGRAVLAWCALFDGTASAVVGRGGLRRAVRRAAGADARPSAVRRLPIA